MSDNLASKKTVSEYLAFLTQLLEKPTNPKLGLDRVYDLLRAIGFKHNAPIIQIVGTNGKGSTAAFIESVLQEHGFATGLFTSPHLSCARERIRINGMMITNEDFCGAAAKIIDVAKNISDEPSFFECMLAMACWLFNQKNVDFIILEAGLGGRLDATTATKPDILGVTTIDLDHQHILGHTIKQIALEKIAASRPGQTVVSVQQVAEAEAVLQHVAHEQGLVLIKAPLCTQPLGLYGMHQQQNAGLALTIMSELHINLDPQKTASGLLRVNWPGRFEIIVQTDSEAVLDGAHNPSGMKILVDALESHELTKGRPIVLVYGSLAGDNAYAKVTILSESKLSLAGVFLHAPKNARALSQDSLHALFVENGVNPDVLFHYNNWSEVKHLAYMKGAVIVVCGSLYTIGEIRSLLLSIDMDEKCPNF